jgi:hypothetical protein
VQAGDPSFDQPSYFDANIGVDNKGISPITQSPRDKDFMSSKDQIDMHNGNINMGMSNDISIL